MRLRLILPLFPILLAMLMLAGGNKAEAAVSVGFSVGGDHHYYHNGGAVVQYRTVDPGYSTWYPDYGTTYVYPDTYYASPYYSTPYIYTTPSTDFNVWFGSDGRRHYGRSVRRR
jgi:hypothetical protein